MGVPTEINLADLRRAIDALDEQIIGLIAERQVHVVEAGVRKGGHALGAVRAPARVEEVIAKVRARARHRRDARPPRGPDHRGRP